MRALSSAGAGFLLAVLWFDLMFDAQVRGHSDEVLPVDVRDSIAAYYRRVTTAAHPMNRLISLVMLTTIVAVVIEITRDELPAWRSILSLIALLAAIGIAAMRTVRNAMQLGRQLDDEMVQSALARSILRDHLLSLAGIVVVLLLQLLPA